MEYFRIDGIDFGVSRQSIESKSETIGINERTWRALKLLLDSNQNTISKDQFVEVVWQGIIVSDASIFKQVQVVRNLFVQLGLADSLIENVYGQGYRLTTTVKPINSANFSNKKTPWTMAALLSLIVLVALVAYQTKPEIDVLSKDQRKNILTLSQENWQEGLTHIDALLLENQDYSTSDLAYLYHQKGQAHLNLQQFEAAREALVQSLSAYKNLADWQRQGEVAMQMARLYDYLDDPKIQLAYITDSIRFFEKAGAETSLVDAMLEKASYQRKIKNYDAAISTYEDVLVEAKKIDDQVGQMMAINNKAALHLVLNQNQHAIALGEQGLELSLKTGNGQHIANSYSFLSQLYWQENQQQKALKLMSQALTYQLETRNHRHLSPKLMNLSYLLLETGQFDKADELLIVTGNYADALKVKRGSAVVALYQGMNEAHQSNWSLANDFLEKSYDIVMKNQIDYQKPTIMAYLALTRAQTGKYLKAIELAHLTLAEQQVGDRERFLAQLAMLLGYDATEQLSLAETLIQEINVPDKWLFAQIIWANTLLNRLPVDDIEGQQLQQQTIDSLTAQWQQLALDSAFDENLLQRLISQVNELIVQLTA
ncbi:MAG: winged helix-turn-helix domain-containing protein [Marinicella sp.]